MTRSTGRWMLSSAPIPLPVGGEARVGVIVGVAMCPRHGKDVNTLITRAGKGRWVMAEDELGR